VDSITDNELMGQVRNGQVEQLGLLFERHHVRLFNFFLRLTDNREASEDLTQDVFYRLLKYRQSFAAGNPFVPWMYQIARHVHYDALRKKARETPWKDEESETWVETISPEPSPDRTAVTRQEIDLLKQALAGLPREKREVLVLSRIQNLRCEEIAQIVGCGASTVRVRIHRALQDLKLALDRLLGEKAL